MSVADQLGLGDPDGTDELLTLAEQRWAGWVGDHPQLAVAQDLPGLRRWLREAAPADADGVLHVLARMAAIDGGDDLAAAAALCWVLLPGACTLANRLRTLSPRIDEVVAAQLWVEARTFPWRRVSKVAGYILVNARVGVLRECGARSQTARVDRTWSNTHPVDPVGPFWGTYAAEPEAEVSAADELLEVLDWASTNNVITGDDRALLLGLVAASSRTSTARVGRGAGGLMANDVSASTWTVDGGSMMTTMRIVQLTLTESSVRPS